MRPTTATLPGTPGEVLQKIFMQPLGLTAYRVATDIEVPPIAVSEILRGLRAITPVTALKLGAYFGVDPRFWMALQAAHDLKLAAEAMTQVMQQSENPPAPIRKCAALGERMFMVRESVDNKGARHWDVLIAKAGAEAPAKKAGPGNAPKKGNGNQK